MQEERSRIAPLVATFPKDLPAGLVVFLVALPLCLGIATASGSSPLSGILAGAIGGIVVGAISKSPLSVSGPAAGLIAIVVGALGQFNNHYSTFQLALLLAGVLQILLGVFRLGAVASFVPSSVIKGMLAGIGILIIVKQIPHALGHDKDYVVPYGFATKLGNNFTDVIEATHTLTPTAVGIFAVSLGILLVWETKRIKSTRLSIFLPGPLVAVLVGAAINSILLGVAPALALYSKDDHLVKLPHTNQLLGSLTLPDWGQIVNPNVWVIGLTLAAVASLETLLSIDAADKLDEQRRATPTNRELIAQGVGNTLSGIVGGLPITSVVVRTSANAYAGAKTKTSTVFHGVLLAVAAVCFPSLLNLIPLSTLAAVLIHIGYKLCRPSVFREGFRAGLDQFLPFLVTVLGVVFTDLLKGVLVGICVAVFFIIRANHHQALTLVNEENVWLLRFNKDVTFASKISLRSLLEKIPDHSSLIIDATRAEFVDLDIIEMIKDFEKSAQFRGITIEINDLAGKADLFKQRRKN